ncbi:MAG: hypothetical protein O6918_16035 [Deltaproteobacteria bacterium]|nr:hypothetical protein [Deltaproteobacteria bacterium]
MKTLRVLVALLATTLILSVASRSHGSLDPKLIEAAKKEGACLLLDNHDPDPVHTGRRLVP